jgi:NAD(P)-dependent dehydrogenase (short-subunit alcohol dehydrogenase family)
MSSSALSGKTAIVTGAGRGIGRAIALRFARAGANVALVSRSRDQLDGVRREIDAAGHPAVVLPCDVSDVAAVERMVAGALARYGRIDVLVNNAGVAPLGTITEMTAQQFDTMVGTNCRAVFACCRAVWPHMARSGGGTIVNISSVAAEDPFPGFAAYGASKAFVNTFTKALAAEGRPAGIRVVAVAPGAVDTEMLRGPFPDFPQDKTLRPDEVAELVEWLLGEPARYVSGQVVRCTAE